MFRVPHFGLLFAGASLAAGCASSPRASAAPELERSGVMSTSVQMAGAAPANLTLSDNLVAKSAIIDMPPDKAFQALEQAYIGLGIPVAERDPATRRIGNQAFRARRKIGDVQMTKVLDCGGDSGMPNAETYQITMNVQSQIKPNDAGGSVLQTVVEGVGRNPLTNAANAVRCISVGGLEAKIANVLGGKVPGS